MFTRSSASEVVCACGGLPSVVFAGAGDDSGEMRPMRSLEAQPESISAAAISIALGVVRRRARDCSSVIEFRMNTGNRVALHASIGAGFDKTEPDFGFVTVGFR